MAASESAGEIFGWHYESHLPIRLQWAGGRITRSEPCAAEQAKVWLAPALVDLQVNGFAGVDFQQPGLTESDLVQAVEGLRAAGCSRFFLTVISDSWDSMLRQLSDLRTLRETSEILRNAIAGWHIEGPFLSAEPGFHGAHDPALMLDASPKHLDQIRQMCGEDKVLLTLSPERAQALEAIRAARKLGFCISLGHTNASADVLKLAVESGATLFTHLANGCPRLLDRHDNIVWRVLDTPGLSVNIIPDGIHVSPPLFRLIHKSLGTRAVYYTSDAMSAAGAPPGKYKLGKLELEVAQDQAVRQPGLPLFAGSALRPVEGVFRAAKMLGCSWQEAWKRFSEIPAGLVSLGSGLAVGSPSEICTLTFSEDRELLKCKLI